MWREVVGKALYLQSLLTSTRITFRIPRILSYRNRLLSTMSTFRDLLIHQREWQNHNVSTGCVLDRVEGARSFTLLTWNHLGDGLAQTGEFKTDPTLLEWDFRYPRIVSEITEINPEIFCLQEVTHPGQLALDFSGYALFFVPKIRSAALKGNSPPDGVAIFVDRARFEVLDVEVIYLKDVGDLKLSNQNAIILTLRDAQSGVTFVLSSTHLKAKSGHENDTLRLHQTDQLLYKLENIKSKLGLETPIIMCGDFNSNPHRSTFATIMASSLDFRSAYNTQEKKQIQRGGLISGVLGKTVGATYGGQKGGYDAYADGEPAFTTWKFRANEIEKKETIDYIFFSSTPQLRCSAILALPSEAQIGLAALPSPFFVSDHLSLAAKFEFLSVVDCESRQSPEDSKA